MPSPEALPPEIWIIIFDVLLQGSLGPVEDCTDINFSGVDRHLISPIKYPPVGDPYRQLHLVCRYFYRVLGGSPYLFMKDDSPLIPVSTKTICINLNQDVPMCIGRILSDSATCRRLVALDIPYSPSISPAQPHSFELLAANARSLPNIRTLTLDLLYRNANPIKDKGEFVDWARINSAFPRLKCLVVRGKCADAPYPTSMVTFANLEILDFEVAPSHPDLCFPSLRRAALGICPPPESLTSILASSRVDSLLLRTIDDNIGFPTHTFSRLLFLGTPITHLYWEDPPGTRLAPYRHMCLYVTPISSGEHPKDVIGYVKWSLKCHIKSIARLTFDFSLALEWEHDWMKLGFKDHGLDSLGFVQVSSVSGSHHLIFEQVQTSS